MDFQLDVRELLGDALTGIEQEIEMEDRGVHPYPYNGQEEHNFMLRQLESATDDTDSPITDEDVDEFRQTDDIYPVVFKVVYLACGETEVNPHVAAYVVICSIFSVVMHSISIGGANTNARTSSLIACHPVTFSAMEEGSSQVPENGEEFREAISSHCTASEWVESEAAATRETLNAGVKMVKRLPRYMMEYDFEYDNLDRLDNDTRPDFQNKEWVHRALTALRKFGSDSYEGKLHGVMAHIENIPTETKCSGVSRFVEGVLKAIEDAKQVKSLGVLNLYDKQIYSLAMRVVFMFTFPAFHTVHHSVCDSQHVHICSFDAPWSRFASQNIGRSKIFIRLAVASFAAHHVDRIIEEINNSRATNLVDIPQDIWESCVMIPYIIGPLLAPPSKRYAVVPETGVEAEVGGVYSGQVIDAKTIKQIQRRNLNGELFVPCRLRHRTFVPLTDDVKRLWSGDGAKRYGYLQDVKHIKKINATISSILLVCKAWNAVLSKYTFRLTARVDNFSESASELQQSSFLMGMDIPVFPTILKSRAASISLVLQRSVPVYSEENNFCVSDQVIPVTTLMDSYKGMHIEAVGNGKSFPVEFAKRMNQCVSAETITLPNSSASATLIPADEETDFLVPVMNCDATTTVCPWKFRCKMKTTSIAASKEVNGPRAPPLPLALRVTFSSPGTQIPAIVVRTQRMFVVSERASAEARQRTAQKRKARTENERKNRKELRSKILYVG
jgi:hypothetical protein